MGTITLRIRAVSGYLKHVISREIIYSMGYLLLISKSVTWISGLLAATWWPVLHQFSSKYAGYWTPAALASYTTHKKSHIELPTDAAHIPIGPPGVQRRRASRLSRFQRCLRQSLKGHISADISGAYSSPCPWTIVERVQREGHRWGELVLGKHPSPTAIFGDKPRRCGRLLDPCIPQLPMLLSVTGRPCHSEALQVSVSLTTGSEAFAGFACEHDFLLQAQAYSCLQAPGKGNMHLCRVHTRKGLAQPLPVNSYVTCRIFPHRI